MITWILILWIHTGPMSDNDSMALTSMEFGGQAACEVAGKAAVHLSDNTYKQTKYVCVRK